MEMMEKETISYPYEICYQGKTIRCRSLREMRSVLNELEGSSPLHETQPWAAEEFDKFTSRIRPTQRQLLKNLLDYGTTTWLEDFKLRQLLGISDNQALAGVLSGISKVALLFDIHPRRVYSHKTEYRHGKAHRYYQTTSAFLQAANAHKWPSKDDLKATR